MNRRWVKGVAAVVFGATVGVSSSVSTAGAEPHWYAYIQWNLWGNKEWHGALDPAGQAIGETIQSINDGYAPYAMSWNEVCSQQADFIRNSLAPYGYHTIFQPLASTGDCPGYGNAITIFSTGIVGTESYQLWEQMGASKNAVTEDRGVMCVLGQLWSQWHSACVTHIGKENGTPPPTYPAVYGGSSDYGELRQLQARHATSLVNSFNSRYPVWGQYFGGDFNMPRSMTQSDPTVNPSPYMGRYEGHSWYPSEPLYTWNMRAAPSVKLDYAFGQGYLYTYAQMARIDLDNYSDHAMMKSYFYAPNLP